MGVSHHEHGRPVRLPPVTTRYRRATQLDEVAALAAQDDLEQPEEEAARVLELLLRDSQQQDDVALHERGDNAPVQVAEPAKSTQELHVGEVPEALERRLADPDTASGGEMGRPASLPERDAPCLKPRGKLA